MQTTRKHTASRPVVAISSCLLGQEVRFDGGHKKDSWITGPLAGYLDYLPICPEVAIGLGIPRPPIRLTGDAAHPRAVGVKDAELDVTGPLEAFARQTARQLTDVSGYILKSKSPSCGMERVPLYGPHGGQKKASGIHARVIMELLPNLPVEEEGRLNDPVLRENFVTRVYVYRRWQDFRRKRLSASGLVAFHAAHKYLLMAHSQAAYKRMGRLLSNLKGADLPAVAEIYITELMAALKRRCNPDRHVNVLQHIMGYLKKRLESDDKQELLEAIEAYRRGEVPLIVPMFLLRHHFRHHPDPYMDSQWYLDPYPAALGLRNNI
jgi:uncharacterized protein YbgA (DUF1722 family)/uncharacterized protein YbbK (DUF523 family)